MNKVLVIGGAGFIGRHLLPRLVAAGASVLATYRVDREGPPEVAGVSWFPSDLSQPTSTEHWPDRVNTVVHLAQSRAWRRFPEGAADVFAVNVAGVFRAAEYARTAGAERLIFLSSGSVYAPSTDALHEDQGFDVPGARAFYPSAKLAAELLLSAYRAAFAVLSLRLFVPYGAGQNVDMLLPQLVRRVRAGEPIILHGVNGFRFNPTAIADVTETVVRCAAVTQTATMNVAGPETLTLRAAGEVIGEVLGVQPSFELRPGSTVADIVADTTRLRSVLDWTPSRTFRDGMRDWLNESPA